MVYRNDSVAEVIGSMVNIKIDGDKDSATTARYGVAGYPTIVLANADGTEIDRIYGYAEPADFIKTINDYMADRNTLADYVRRAEKTPSSSLFYVVADKYTGRKKFAEAETYYNKILAMDPQNAQGYSDSALYSMGDMKVRAKEFAAADASYKKLMETYPKSDLADDALFGMAVSKRRADQFDEAIARFRAFMETHPKSDLAPDAELYIAYCHDKKGAKEEAVTLYKKFIANNPASSDTGWAKEQIDKILNPPKEGEKK